MSRSRSLTTTSYALLGLLAIRPWSSYELTRQMEWSLSRFWPRAKSKLFEEPKKLERLGLASSRQEATGNRTRTVYAITPAGRRAIREWHGEPTTGFGLEAELRVNLPAVERAVAEQLIEKAHMVCPYSNATRGNISVSLKLV